MVCNKWLKAKEPSPPNDQKISKAEQVKYDKFLSNLKVKTIPTATKGEEGIEEGKTAMILGAYKKGIPVSEIADIADRTKVEVEKILIEHGLLQK